MHCTCVRHTDLPHTTQLFADVLYHPDRTANFYRHPIRDLDAFRAAAAEIRFAEPERAALVAALRVQNPDGPSLERLAQPGTVAVVTGQQVGLFSGPAYTVYKALHAAKLAEWLTANGIPAVPVFWLATEDHDFAEVNHVWVFDCEHHPRQAGNAPHGELPAGWPRHPGGPSGERNCERSLRGLPFGEEVADTRGRGLPRRQHHGQGIRRTGARFAGAARHSTSGSACCRNSGELAAPALRRAVEAAPELTARVLERNRELTGAGYHAQVHMEEQTSLVFLLENDKRLGLRRHGEEYVLNGRRFTAAELMDRAADAFAQCTAAAGGAGFHAPHGGLYRRSRGSGLPGAIRGHLPRPSGPHAGGGAAQRLHHSG